MLTRVGTLVIFILLCTTTSILAASKREKKGQAPKRKSAQTRVASSSTPLKKKDLLETVVGVIPTAAADALTIDAPYMVSMAAFNSFGIVSTGTRFGIVIPFVIGAFLGQTVRHACKQYYTGGDPSILCGYAAGAMKYGSRYLLSGGSVTELPVIITRGAIDIGNYEMDRSTLLEANRAGNVAKVMAMVYKNELFNEFVAQAFNSFRGIPVTWEVEGVKTAILVPTLLNTYSFTTSAYYSEFVKDSIDGFIKGTFSSVANNETKSEL